MARRPDGIVAATFTVADAEGAPLAGLAGTARLAAPADTAFDSGGGGGVGVGVGVQFPPPPGPGKGGNPGGRRGTI